MEGIRKFYRIPAAIGVSVTLGGEKDIYALSHLRFGKQGLDLVTTKFFQQTERLVSYCLAEPSTPVSVYFEGKGILVKEILQPDDAEWNEELISQIFPHFSSDKFYYSYLGGNDRYWVAIAKRDVVDKIILQLEDKHIPVVQIFIGPFLFDAILKHVDINNKHYLFRGHWIQIDENGIWNMYKYDVQEQGQFQHKVGSRSIDAQYISSYAAAFNTLMHEFVVDRSLIISRLIDRFDEVQAKVRFKRNSLFLLATTFVLLLVSTALHQYYNFENETLTSLNNHQVSFRKDVDQLKKEITQKELLLHELGWSGGISNAWLLDQLGISLNYYPNITLTDIWINRKPERSQRSEGLRQDSRKKVLLKGKCTTLAELNQWVQNLNQEQWIDQVQITKFSKPSTVDDDEGFSIEISLDNEMGKVEL